jgi:hypothetical protein
MRDSVNPHRRARRARATARQRLYRRRQRKPGKVGVLRNQEVDIDRLGRAFANSGWLDWLDAGDRARVEAGSLKLLCGFIKLR